MPLGKKSFAVSGNSWMAGNWSQLSYFTLSYSALSAPLVSKMKILSFMQSSVVLFHGSSQRCGFFFPSPLHPSPQLLMFCLQQQQLNGLNAVPLLERRHFRLTAVPSEGREVSGDTETWGCGRHKPLFLSSLQGHLAGWDKCSGQRVAAPQVRAFRP